MNVVEHEIIKLKGIVLDIEPMELQGIQTWTRGANVVFDDDATHRVGGYRQFADPYPVGAKPIFLHPVLTPDTSYWIYISDDGVDCKCYVTDGTTHWDITPATGLTTGGPGIWTGTTLNGIPVLNNGLDYPFWWNGETGTPCTTIPGWPVDQYAKSVRAYKYHLVALNLTRSGVRIPNMLAWSSAADPGTIPDSWDPLPGNDAGDALLSDDLGGLVDAETLRDNLMIYRQHSTAYASYVAGQYVFVFRELFNTSGIQALNCATEVRGKHYVITDDDIIVHDGNQYTSIADNVIRSYVFAAISPEQHHLCCAETRTSKDEVWFCFPYTDSENLSYAAVYSLEDDLFGLRELPEVTHVRTGIIPEEDFDATWDGALSAWQQDPRFWNEQNYSETNDGMMMADPVQSRLLNVDASNDNDGEPIEAFVERTMWTVGGSREDLWTNVLTRSLWPYITGTPGDVINVRIGGAMSASAPVRWSASQPYVIGSENVPKLDSFAFGRLLSIRFSSSGGDPWQIHRFGFDYVPQTKY